jgi:hypothetical protein
LQGIFLTFFFKKIFLHLFIFILVFWMWLTNRSIISFFSLIFCRFILMILWSLMYRILLYYNL